MDKLSLNGQSKCDNNVKRRKSKSFMSKILKPMIVFNTDKDKDEKDDVEISGVIPGTGQKNVSFRIDNHGKLDLNTVPDEFREIATKLWANVSQPKFLNDNANDECDDGIDTPPALRRGPRVEKDLSEDTIMDMMRDLVNNNSPWTVYQKVRVHFVQISYYH